jgi:hypothetical protein
MKKYMIGIVAGLALCFTGFAMASGDVCPPVTMKGGIIIGGEVGYGELNTPLAFTELDNYVVPGQVSYEKYSQDLGDFVWAAHLGYAHQLACTGWLSNMLLGIEAGFKDFGKSDYTYTNTPPAPDAATTAKVEYSGYGIDALLTAHYYIWEGWNAFVKGGVIVMRPKTEVTYTRTPEDVQNPNYSVDHQSWVMRPEVELGTGYTFCLAPNMHLDVHIMYLHIATEPAAGMASNFAYGNHFGNAINVPGLNAALGGIDFSFNPTV